MTSKFVYKIRLALIPIAVCALVLTGCARESVEEITPEPTEEETEEPDPTQTPTPEPTETPEPTATPTDEPTEEPTAEEDEAGSAANDNTSSSNSGGNTNNSSEGEETPTEEETEETGGLLPDFAPREQSVWQLDNDPSEFYSSAACAEPFYYNFYGLVAISPVQQGLSWTVPAGTTYYVEQQSENVYWGTGRHVVPGFQLTISVVFGSEEGLGVTYVLISDENKECNHVFKYNAVRAW